MMRVQEILTPSRLFHGTLSDEDHAKRTTTANVHCATPGNASPHRAPSIASHEVPHAVEHDCSSSPKPSTEDAFAAEAAASDTAADERSEASSGRFTAAGLSSPEAGLTSGSGAPPRDLDPTLQLKIEQLRRIPRLIPDIERFFRLGVIGMLDSLLASLMLPLKMLCVPKQVDRRDVITVGLTLVGLATYVWMGYPESTMLYSALYHYIRTTAIIKLYLLFSILEVSDKLLTSLLSDSLEVLYARTTAPDQLSRTTRLSALAVSCVGAALHSAVLLLYVVTLNVALNSEENSLLALLISNNFVEVRSVVFKKYTPETLMQCCCSDALERFQLILFMCCMLTQHVQSEGFGMVDLTDVSLVLGCELFIDFVKHYFVATFNRVSLSWYRLFSQVLMFDVAAEKNLWSFSAKIPVTLVDESSKPVSPQPRTGATADLVNRLMNPIDAFVANPARRFGFVPMPYMALLLWCTMPLIAQAISLRLFGRMMMTAALLVAVKLCTYTYLVGTAERFVVRGLLHRVDRATLPTAEAASQQREQQQQPAASTLLERRKSQSLLHLSSSINDVHRELFGRSPPTMTPSKEASEKRALLRRSSSAATLLLRGPSEGATTRETPLSLRDYELLLPRRLASLIQVERFDLHAGKASVAERK